MIIFYKLILAGLGIGIFFYIRWVWALRQARRRGNFLFPEKATMFDVRRLLQQGEKDLAVRLYGILFRTTIGESRKAVDELERGMKEKRRGDRDQG
jgi:hypothetical protein